MLQRLERWRPARWRGLLSPSRSTDSDIYTLYRVLLGRATDAEGLDHFRRRLAAGASIDDVAAEMLRSAEFARRYESLAERERAERVLVEVEGFSVLLDPADRPIGATVMQQHNYEPHVSAALRSLLRPGDVFVDVGANIGWFSLLAASHVGESGRVIAIEPNPENVSLLRASCASNGFAQVEIVSAAAYDRPGLLSLVTDASNGLVLPLGATEPSGPPGSYVVSAVTLDEMLSTTDRLGEASVLKVDVEGAEARVIEGAGKLLEVATPVLIFEWYPEALRGAGATDPTAPLEMLREHRYAISVIGDHGRVDPFADLGDEELEEHRLTAGRELLELVAFPTKS